MTPVSSPAPLRARFWGVRGSIPTPMASHLGVGGNTSCVEVRAADGTVLVLDGGTGARGLGLALAAEAAGRPLEIHVVLSHFHWDHLQGLPFFAPLFAAGHEVTFYAVAEAAEVVDQLLGGQMRFPYFPVPFEKVAATTRAVPLVEGAAFAVGPMTVRPFALNHPQGAHGFRVEADGASLVYASDYEHGVAAFDAGLRAAARGADLLIADAQYTPEEYALRRGWGHSTWAEATRVAADAGVGALRLFHHDPAHDDAVLEGICAQARAAFPATELAREGDTVELGRPG